MFRSVRILSLFVAAYVASARAAAAALSFEVTLDRSATDVAIDGRLFVYVSAKSTPEPRFAPNWFNPEPFFGLDVKRFEPGQSRRVDDTADGFPDKLSKLPPGKYRVQALLDHDFYSPRPADGVGNFYSDVSEVQIEAKSEVVMPLTLNRVVKEKPFPATRFVQEVVFESELLSKFHKRKVVDRCGVALPASYFDQPERRYPLIFIIPGFGGSHVPPAAHAKGGSQAAKGEAEFIRVYLSGRCKWGHHVYADSATNGPRGQSLVEELIPRIETTYRTATTGADGSAKAASTARSGGPPRFLNGHSSGGWSSLWLQVSYPDTFAGTWSTSPDPVDFRDYQQVDLYAEPPLSLYLDEHNERRPIARRLQRDGGKPSIKPVLWYDSFGRMDDVQKRGGQLRSFEAVFSPRGPDGEPRQLWDRRTGRIDPEVARAWQQYDIRLKIERNWTELRPKLAGKLHIITGEFDTFYLEGAVRKLGATLKKLGSDAVVEILPGRDHSNVMTAELAARIRREMSAAYLLQQKP
jgi:hypothetical protein